MPRCPGCKVQATPIEYERVRIYHCGGCGGHWMAPQRLDVILGRREVAMPEAVKQKLMDMADASHTKHPLFCFGCGTRMEKRPFRWWDDIILDHCPKCHGIWLDRGELEKCQIYWEYAQDNPDQWENLEVEERKALLEAQLKQRKHDTVARQEEQAEMWRGFWGAGWLSW